MYHSLYSLRSAHASFYLLALCPRPSLGCCCLIKCNCLFFVVVVCPVLPCNKRNCTDGPQRSDATDKTLLLSLLGTACTSAAGNLVITSSDTNTHIHTRRGLLKTLALRETSLTPRCHSKLLRKCFCLSC